MNTKRLSKISVIIGAFVVSLPVGIPWYYGNLYPYLLSYFLYYIGPPAFDVQSDWLLSTYVIMAVLALLTADWFVTRFGAGLVHIAAALLFDLGMILTYFSVQYSVGLTLITLMSCGGFTTGLVTMISLKYASQVDSNYVGMASAFVASGFGFGAILFNAITTVYINPGNLAPDIRHTSMAYFSQAAVLDKVPGVFIVLGLTSFGLHLVGLLLEQLPLFEGKSSTGNSPSSRVNENTAVVSKSWSNVGLHLVGLLLEQLTFFGGKKSTGICSSSRVNEKTTVVNKSFSDVSKANTISEESRGSVIKENIPDRCCSQKNSSPSCASEKTAVVNKSFSNTPKTSHTCTTSEENRGSVLKENNQETTYSSLVLESGQSNSGLTDESNLSLTPGQVLCTSSFYQLWLSLAILSYGGLFTQNFYKLFGQLWIKDDSFLTFMGSVGSVTMSAYRVVIGVIMDKIGVKNTLVVTLSLHAVLMAFWYFTPRLDRWLFFTFYQAISCIQGSIYIVFPMATLRQFGSCYYATNYGLLMTANMTISLVCPPLYPILLDGLGWFGLIQVASAGSVLVFISLVLLL